MSSKRPRRNREAGIGVLEVAAIVGVLILVAGPYFKSRKNSSQSPLVGGLQSQTRLNECLAQAQLRKAALVGRYSRNEQIPQDDADLEYILGCQRDVTRILKESAAASPDPKWADMLTLLNEPIENVGTCTFRVTFPKSKPAGQAISVGLAANIPLSNPSVKGQVLASTTETATLDRIGNLKFDGNIYLDGTNRSAGTVTFSLAPTPNIVPPVQCPTATFAWTDPLPYSVSFNPPAGGTTVTTDLVFVEGKVVPKPPPNTVQIKTNGKFLGNTSTDDDGNFSFGVRFAKAPTLGDLTLTNPGRSVVACGTDVSGIFLRLNPNAVQLTNYVTAAVVEKGGGRGSNTATLAFTHVVDVKSIQVSWPSGTCRGPTVNLPAGQILKPQKSQKLGEVVCGIECPSFGYQCKATARVDIDTSVGATYTEAQWDVKIDPEPEP